MTIYLDHTIVPSKNKQKAAQFFARIFGLSYDGLQSHFAPVHVNDILTLDFDDEDGDFDTHHYAFRVTDAEFDAIFGRLKADRVVYGSGPLRADDMEINRRRGGRGCYFRDLDGHLFEIKTT